MSQSKRMKFRYIYQQFFSHISIIVVAFLVLSLLIAHYVENLVYENKANELISYQKAILSEIEETPQAADKIINRYTLVLTTRKMSFSMFDQYGKLYAVRKQGPAPGGL